MATVVFALGSNGSGQLGIGHHADVSVPKPVIFHPSSPAPAAPVKSLAAGGNHTLLLTEAGEVFWAGDAASGACGPTSRRPADPEDADARAQCVFRRMHLSPPGAEKREQGGPGEESIAMVAATWEASILVARDRDGRATKVYTLGSGLKGELGQGELLVRTPSASVVRDFPPADAEIVDVSACMAHVVVVLDNGDAYGWGAGRKGQLGEPPEAVVSAPRRIHVPFAVARAVCGREFTALFAAPSDGRLAVLGPEKLGTVADAPAEAGNWVNVAAGWGAVYVLHGDGTVRAWGRDDHGGLPPPGLPRITQLRAGSEHVVALSGDGEVLAWGWAEHGNCGPVKDGTDVKGRWNVIASHGYMPPGARITGADAGCATSWVYIVGI